MSKLAAASEKSSPNVSVMQTRQSSSYRFICEMLDAQTVSWKQISGVNKALTTQVRAVSHCFSGDAEILMLKNRKSQEMDQKTEN